MREAICICFCFLLAFVPQPPGGQRIGIAGALQRAYAGIKRDITQAAEKMPDTDYGSKPTSMADVRTFAQVIGHIADGHYGTCGSLKADSSRPQAVEQHDQSLKSKADLVKALAESFAFCDDVLASTTDENALAFVRQGPYEVTRASLLYGLLAHDAEMYGIATVYLRAKGIVPPSTEHQSRGRGNR